jgi:replication-associated recombination protein RarA
MTRQADGDGDDGRQGLFGDGFPDPAPAKPLRKASGKASRNPSGLFGEGLEPASPSGEGEVKEAAGRPGWAFTKRRYPFDEVASAFIKTLRRGLESEAAWWAWELLDSGMGNYVFKRLATLAVEDVGMSNPNLIVQVNALWQAWLQIKKSAQGEPDRDLVAMGVLLCCRSSKGHEVDDLKNCLWYRLQLDPDYRPEIPDYALDCHTQRGRKMGRGDQHWYEEARKLDREVQTGDGRYAAEVKELMERAIREGKRK